MTAPTLTVIAPRDIRSAWPSIRDRVEKLSRGERWIAEDVYKDLIVGNAYLWTTPDLDGFVVLQVLASPTSKDLHIWIACNDSEGTIEEFMEQLRAIAREQDFDRICFESPRRGWKRALPTFECRYTFIENVT